MWVPNYFPGSGHPLFVPNYLSPPLAQITSVDSTAEKRMHPSKRLPISTCACWSSALLSSPDTASLNPELLPPFLPQGLQLPPSLPSRRSRKGWSRGFGGALGEKNVGFNFWFYSWLNAVFVGWGGGGLLFKVLVFLPPPPPPSPEVLFSLCLCVSFRFHSSP